MNLLQAYKDAIQQIDDVNNVRAALVLLDNIRNEEYIRIRQDYSCFNSNATDPFNELIETLLACERLIKALTDFCVHNENFGVCILKKLPENKIKFDIKKAVYVERSWENGR